MGLLTGLGDLVPWDHTSALLFGGAGIFVSFAIHSVYVWHRLCHIPGPRYAGWSVWWQLSGAVGERFHEKLQQAADVHGKLGDQRDAIFCSDFS